MRNSKKEIECLGCGKKFLRIPSLIRKNNFCSLKCRDNYNIEKRYGHLYQTFNENINEIAYLFGLILGDGHQRKITKNTTRISIGFDVKYKKLIDTFKNVAEKLKIKYFVEPKKHNNCQAIGFTVPDNLLDKYEMLYDGAKYDSQPKPVDEIINNINFAIGLINSDGCCRTVNGRYREINFINTTKSIVDCFNQSLKYNNIVFSTYARKGNFDKRTGNTGKDFWAVRTMDSKKISSLIKISNIKMKEFK